MAPQSKGGQELNQELKKTNHWTLQNLNPITKKIPCMLLYYY